MALKAADPVFGKKAVYLDACRRKRNTFLYEQANIVSHTEAEELLWHASGFALEVDAWLNSHFPGLT